MANERIKSLEMTMTEVVMELSREEGGGYNPGAYRVCMDILGNSERIDPDCAMPLPSILSLDSHNIWGHRIWMLFKDVCGEDLVKMIGVLRSVQLGILSESALNHAIDNRGQGLNVDELVAKVKEQLPDFGKNP